MIAHICQSLGWQWDHVLDSMTLPRFYALCAYWRTNPPPHLLLKAFVGYRAPKGKAPPAEEKGDLGMLLAMFPGGRIG